MPNRTPGPWVASSDKAPDMAGAKWCIRADGWSVAYLFGTHSDADAAFIVTACNAYDSHLARIAELEGASRVARRFVATRGHTDECFHSDGPACECGYDEARRALAGKE